MKWVRSYRVSGISAEKPISAGIFQAGAGGCLSAEEFASVLIENSILGHHPFRAETSHRTSRGRGTAVAESADTYRTPADVEPSTGDGSETREKKKKMHSLGRPAASLFRASGGLLMLELAAVIPNRSRIREGRLVVCPRCDGRTMASRLQPFSTQLSPESKDGGRPGAPVECSDKAATQGGTGSPADHELPSTMESRRRAMTKKFSQVMDRLQSRVLTASHALNDMTGYSAIDGIKADNEALEAELAAAQEHVRTARQAYRTSNTKRATTQREVTTMLARKDSWTPTDLERFTELYRTDHVLEGEVAGAQEALAEAEAREQSLSQRLNAGILKRYHEEQIWSDRIRRASTWGTWGLMGMNFVLFVALQFVAEPWKRRRLVQGVVEEEKLVLDEVRRGLEAVRADVGSWRRREDGERAAEQQEAQQAEQAGSQEAGGDYGHASWQGVQLGGPGGWAAAAADLCSERRIELRMRDASMLALQGVLTGAVMVGSLALLLARRS